MTLLRDADQCLRLSAGSRDTGMHCCELRRFKASETRVPASADYEKALAHAQVSIGFVYKLCTHSRSDMTFNNMFCSQTTHCPSRGPAGCVPHACLWVKRRLRPRQVHSECDCFVMEQLSD